ncbi:MAG: capsule assembly Wzi family protein [Gemmatimonadaceae bacterium]
MTLSNLFRPRVLACCAGLLAGAPSLRAQGTALVPPSDLVYADIDRLSELGILDSVMIGQRPYSRREIGRIVRAARDRLDGRPGTRTPFADEVTAYASDLLRRLDRFADAADVASFSEPIIRLVDGASLTATSTDADRRGFPAVHTKPIEATIDPLNERRLGTPAVRGQLLALELSHRMDPSGWLSIQARERVETRRPDDTTLARTKIELLLASVRARYRNVALTIGRQQFAWSQSANDGLFLASDAPALDQISLAGDRPFVLPGLLRYLGPTQTTIIVADLGASVSRSHSKLLTYKVSVQPTSSLELGGTFMNHFGGKGGRTSSSIDRLIDFLPFIDVFRKHNYTDTTKSFDVDSDKLLGVDGRLRIAALGGVTLTGELLIDDFDVNRIPKLLTGYGSQTFGLTLPRIGSPALSMKLSAKHMGTITYSHNALLDGITTRGRLLGEELGPDAKSFSAQLRWEPTLGARLEIEGRSAIYSNAAYAGFYSDSAHRRLVVQKVSHTPNELRDLLIASLILQSNDGIAVTARGGAERTRNANFQGGRRRDYVAQIAIRIGQ